MYVLRININLFLQINFLEEIFESKIIHIETFDNTVLVL